MGNHSPERESTLGNKKKQQQNTNIYKHTQRLKDTYKYIQAYRKGEREKASILGNRKRGKQNGNIYFIR